MPDKHGNMTANDSREWLKDNGHLLPDWPQVRSLDDDYGFRIIDKVITPETEAGARFWDGFAGLFVWVLVIGTGVGAYQIERNVFGSGDTFWFLLVAAVVMLLIGFWEKRGKFGLHLKSGELLDVIVTPHSVGVGRTWKYEWLDTGEITGFQPTEHPKARQEARKEAVQRTNESRFGGRPKYFRPVYRDTQRIVINYGSKQVKVADIFRDHEKASQLTAVLYCLRQEVHG